MANNGEFLRDIDPRRPEAFRPYDTAIDFSDRQLGGVNAVRNPFRFKRLIADYNEEKRQEKKKPDSKPSE